MKTLNIVAFGAHPDDVELACGGTLAKYSKLGHNVFIVDLTAGDYGTRGSVEERLAEAVCAAQQLGIRKRINLRLEDIFFEEDREALIKVVDAIRLLKPDIALIPSPVERHPDHERSFRLIKRAIFMAGLRNLWGTRVPNPHRPSLVLHYIQHTYIHPEILIDVTDTWVDKVSSLQCYRSQFDPAYPAPETILSTKRFMEFLESRASMWGFYIGVDKAEGFVRVDNTPLHIDLFDLIKV
ncbi:MAG: bacillithiol biosynthesis deacetylase BshB1 [Chlorobi bacterium]|nr:bacillithiol biosynthesis deacetylase BshB1 [Chlorobiota bacterium]